MSLPSINFPRYSPDKIFTLKVTTARSKVKSRSDHDFAYLQSLPNVPTKYQLSTPYGFRDIARTRFYNRQEVKVTTARSKVKSRSGHDVAHLHPLTNVSTTYQLPTPYGFRDIARTRFYRSRSLRQGQRSNQGQAMTLHIYTPWPMSLPRINFLHLMVSEI